MKSKKVNNGPNKFMNQVKQYCKNGYMCPNLSRNCPMKHDKYIDEQRYEAYQDIRQRNTTIIVLNTLPIKPEAMCLFSDVLPIQIVPSGQQFTILKPGIYYRAEFIKLNQDNVVLVEIKKQLGKFGDLSLQIKIMKQYCRKQYVLENSKEKSQLGRVDVNWQYVKVLKGNKYKKYFDIVNKRGVYPLIYGCEVRYIKPSGNSAMPKVLSINYPKKKLSGVLQIDPKGLLYMMCRNMKIDDLSPNQIPQNLIQQVQPLKAIVPYSMLKRYEISQKLENEINIQLKKFIVKGQFHSWSEYCRYPLITILPEFSLLSYKSLKDAIIYESSVVSTQFSNKQIRDGIKIKDKYKIENYKNRNQQKMPVFAIDNKGTRCHDDAFSINKIGQNLKVCIHIADVAQIIKQTDLIDIQMEKRDQTIYIKDYYMPLLMKQLIQIVSLREGTSKLSQTLSFYMNQNGLIDFQTVKFEDSIIKVEKNWSHTQKLEDKQVLKDFFLFGDYLDKAKLVESSYFVSQESTSEVILSKLIHLSAMIPTAMIKFNEKRILKFKESIDKYINDTINEGKTKILQWEKIRKQIKQLQKNCQQFKSEQLKVETMIRKDLQKQGKKIKAQLLQKKKQNKKKQRDISGEPLSENDSDISQQSQAISQIESMSVQSVTGADIQKNLIEQQHKEQEQQKIRKQKMNRLMAAKTIKVQQSSDSQQFSDEDDEMLEQQEQQIMKLKKQAAIGGLNYIQKIFNYFKISMEWYSLSDIRKSFTELYGKNKANLFQKYIKRAQVMNKQHFKYWLKQKQPKKYAGKPYVQKSEKSQKSEKTDNESKNGGKRNFGEKYEQQQKIIFEKIEQSQGQFQKKPKLQNKDEGLHQSSGKKQRRQRKPKRRQNKFIQKNQKEVKNDYKSEKAEKVQKKQQLIIHKQHKIGQQQQGKYAEQKHKNEQKGQKKQESLKPPQINFQPKNKMVSTLQQGKIDKKYIKQIAQDNGYAYFLKYYKQKKVADIWALKKLSKLNIFDTQQEINMISKLSLELQQYYYEHKLNQIIFIVKKSLVFTRMDEKQCKQQLKQTIRTDIQQLVTKEIDAQKYGLVDYYEINYQQILSQLHQYCWTQYTSIQSQQQEIKDHDQKCGKEQQNEKKIKGSDYQFWITKAEIENLNPRQKYFYGKYKMVYIHRILTKILNNKLRSIKQSINQQLLRHQQYYISLLNNDALDIQKLPQKIYIRVGDCVQQKIKEEEFKDQLQQIDKCDYELYKNQKLNLLKSIKNEQQLSDQRKNQIKTKARNVISKHWEQLIKNNSPLLNQIQQLKKVAISETFQMKQSDIYPKLEEKNYKIFSQVVFYQKWKNQAIRKKILNYKQSNKNEQKKVQDIPLNIINASNKEVSHINQKQQKSNKHRQQIKKQQAKQGTDTLIKKIAEENPITKDSQVSKPDDIICQKDVSNKLQQQILSQEVIKNEKDNKNQSVTEGNLENKTKSKSEMKIEKRNLSKKQLKKTIDGLLLKCKQQLQQKYGLKQIKQKFLEQTSGPKHKIKQLSDSMKQKVKQIENQFNFLEYMVQLHQEANKSDNSKNKNKKNKNKSKQKKVEVNKTIESIKDTLDILYDYMQTFGYKLKKLKVKEIEEFIQTKVPMQALISQQNEQEDFKTINKQFSAMFANQSQISELQLLKWNNPIRSYAALKTLRLIKKYSWMLNGRINAFDVLYHQKQFKHLNDEIKRIKDFKATKTELGQVKKNYQQANRQIQKLNFFYYMKKNKQSVFDFLNVGSPCEREVKFVFHDILGEVQIKNLNFKQKMYEVVKGKVEIVREFPVQFKVQLI